ncbi:MAG TPA: hypothetical protein VGF99_10865, partial [Myxococcota bacterium]
MSSSSSSSASSASSASASSASSSRAPSAHTQYTSEGVAVGDNDILALTRPADQEQLEALERKFWALMRSLARRGLITKEEFLSELRIAEGSDG